MHLTLYIIIVMSVVSIIQGCLLGDYGDFGPIPHVVLSLSVAQGGLTLCISLVSISVRGLVPLHNACSYGHYEVAELLVKVIHLRECFTGSWCMKDLPVV